MFSGIPVQDSQQFIIGPMNYWDQVRESGGFDIEHITAPQNTCGLMPYDCEDESIRYPNRVLVNLYARLGLHRYNLSEGRNLEFHHLKKFNTSMTLISSYRITLVAYDPATNSLVTFLVGVSEQIYGRLNLMVFIARPQANSPSPLFKEAVWPQLGITNDAYYDKGSPFWPTDFDDTERFYLLKDPEIQGNDWIRLYLELALCSNDRNIPEWHVSQLQIVRVAVETIQYVVVSNVNFYITFKGLPVAQVGEDGENVERKVIVRRFVDLSTGYFTLKGGFGFSVGEVASEGPMTRLRSIKEIRADLRLHPTTRPCPAIPIADWWKS
ncbi:unnamed protein product [Brassica oleracea var. botrytis]